MKSSTRLDSAVFQLTPTRTRCDLVLSANGKTEKIASGLANPFITHLKTAQDQMAKGGYSVILEPQPGNDATWFTKGTVERFVRFVSTPEVLERVYTLESEILQIEEAIALQKNNDVGDPPVKPVERIEGSRPQADSTEEKAIVLYKPGAHPPEANGSTVQEGNSKIQLMKVLETRKTVLQKEQGMAFARAAAAGFDIDHMTPLLSFGESFGALRLMDACVRFMELWKRKHETGQWVEIEAAEAMSSRSDFSALNASGIVLSNVVNKQWPETPHGNRKGAPSVDEKPPMDQHPPPGHQEYYPGQFPHPLFPSWPVHSPPGAMPVFQGYPMQGIPYYQNYPGNSPVFQPPYPPGEDPRHNTGPRIGHRRHSMDSNTEPETMEVDALKPISLDDEELEMESLGSRELGRKGSRSSKKQSGVVVIRNINYITSKSQDSSGSESQSASGSETDEEAGDMKHRNLQRSSKRKGSHTKSMDKLNSTDKEGTVYGKEEDAGHWQAFQNYLLKDAEEAERSIDQGMFAMEKEVHGKRRQNKVDHDPLAFDGRNQGGNQEESMENLQNISGNLTRKTRISNDESLISRRMGQSSDGRRYMDAQSAEIDCRRGVYRRTAHDDFIINKSGYSNSLSDPLAINGFERANNDLERKLSNNMDDDSYVVSLRPTSLDQAGAVGRNAIDMDSEFPSAVKRAENSSKRVGSQVQYEPDDLSLMPERGTEKGSTGYDPALEYDMHVCADNGAPLDKKNKVGADVKQGSKKLDKDRKSKLVPGPSDRKKTVGPIRKGKPSKLSPLDEARARAERLRTFKADLQKMKKEKEEEEIKRLEALKLERQKRIAARGGSIPTQSASQQTGKQLLTKLSPSSRKGSKFSDSEPGSSSPLLRFPIKTVSAGSGDPPKTSKSNKLSTGNPLAGNRLSRSVSSLPEPMKDQSGVTPDTKASMARIRRLSEPKISSSHLVSSVKPRNAEASAKPKVSNGPESKKISAIVNHDKSKAAALPELKIRTTKGTDVTHGKSAAKEIQSKVNGSKSTITSEGAELKGNVGKISKQSDGDDNPIIEKTVVMLECEKPSIPNVHTSEENMGVQEGHSGSHQIRDQTDTALHYAAIRAPISPLTVDGVDKEPIEYRSQKQPGAYEATTENISNSEKELPKVSSIQVAEKPYHAPFARVSSLENPCMGNSEYGRAPPSSLQTLSTGSETLKAHVSDSKSLKFEKIPETMDKPKESSKGFRRLLKFGRKSHTTGDHNESDNGSVYSCEADDNVSNTASSSEVYTLKNLISQDETPAVGSAPQKTSRHFSLFSPFRSKPSEKKTTT